VSCSVHDVIRFEKTGIPTVNIGTDAFVDEGEEQARLLAMPDYRMVWLPHPVAILGEDQIRDLARQTAGQIVRGLTAA
jgi:hypothetical protein